jgi:hypothetical protein
LSIRNTFRRKGRLVLTLVTLTVSGAIFIAVFNVRVSMQEFMRQHNNASSPISRSASNGPVGEVEQAVFQVRASKAGSLVEALRDRRPGWRGDLRAIIFPPPVLINPEMEAGAG